jgi:hypothetical protein
MNYLEPTIYLIIFWISYYGLHKMWLASKKEEFVKAASKEIWEEVRAQLIEKMKDRWDWVNREVTNFEEEWSRVKLIAAGKYATGLATEIAILRKENADEWAKIVPLTQLKLTRIVDIQKELATMQDTIDGLCRIYYREKGHSHED